MKKLYLFIMFAVLASLGFANAATVTDVLTAKLFTATGSSYTDFSNVTAHRRLCMPAIPPSLMLAQFSCAQRKTTAESLRRLLPEL